MVVFRYLTCALCLVAPAMAGEYAILSSGLRLHVDHHETAEGSVRLFDKSGGVTELAADQVKGFEPDDYVPPRPPPPPPAPAPQQVKLPEPADPKTMVHEAAGRMGPPNFVKLVESVAKVESAFRPDAVSPKGALGVMQLMPDTARALAADPTDLEQNIDAGTRLLQDLLIKYNGDVVKALAAYNAGPGAVDRYQGIPPFRETQSYVDKVIRNYLKAGGQ